MNHLDFETCWALFTSENIEEMMQTYATAGGPLVGIVLPFIEAFLPFLPLIVIAFANAAAFGLWKGFFYTWLGSVLGTILVFHFIRKFGRSRLEHIIHRYPKFQHGLDWIERHGFGPVFILLCFPFSPSILINIVGALSRMNYFQFVLAALFGKCVMIFTLSFIGSDITAMIAEPIKSVKLFILIGLVWMLGKWVEKKYQFHQNTQEKTKNEK